MSNPWMAFYFGDYIADTGHLSLAQHGAYLLLMAHYYRTKRAIPANAEQLHRICRCTTDADRHATNAVLDEFFVLADGVYRHLRIDQELAKANGISEKRRAAANHMHKKARANASASAEQLHTQPQPQPQAQPEMDPCGASAPTSAKQNRASQMPGDFKPTDAHRLLAGTLCVDLEAAFLTFTDHHLSKGSAFKDWDRALNLWLRNESKFARSAGASGRGAPHGKPSIGQIVEREIGILHAHRAQ